MRLIITLLLYSQFTLQPAWGSDITLRIGTHSIRAALAGTPQSRARGLMQQTQLCGNCGMLFVFPKAGKYSFWMKDTPLPLSIAFIAGDGRILNITEMQANSTHTHSAHGDILYALEMNKGWFTEHAIQTQSQVQGLHQAPLGQ